MSNLIVNKIKEKLHNKKSCVWTCIIKTDDECFNYVKSLLKEYPSIFHNYTEAIFFILNGLDLNNLDKCINCGKSLPITKIIRGSKYCCKKCADTSNERREKISKTKRSDEAISKYKETCIKRYGVDNVSKSNNIRNKIKNTHLSHSSEYNSQANEKRKNTCIKKYNVEYPLQSTSILQSMKIKELEKNGVSHHTKRKSYKISFNAITYNKFNRFSKYVIPLFSLNEFVSMGGDPYNVEFKWKCLKCNNEFYSKITRHKGYIPRCIKCYPSTISRFEDNIIDFLKHYNIDVKKSDRSLISPQELDIVIPSKKIAIEFNGNYWHSEERGKDTNYHLNKTKKCEEKGYKLIHIFEDEWINKKQIVKSRLKNILGFTKYRIFARKCIIREISSELKSKFLEKYHIQGDCIDSIRLGLFYKNRLVAVMTFGKRRFDKKEGFELIRYVTISNFNIIGGAGKLLNYFSAQYNKQKYSIISYADRRWSQGNLYKTLGFKLIRESGPNYFYMNKKDLMKRYNRVQFQRHKLKNKLEIFDDTKSEAYNMTKNGYVRIFDCGNYVFEL